MAWTPERIEELKYLASQGLSNSQIARALGGLSRNAVIGKLHRMGLTTHNGPSRSPRKISLYSQLHTPPPKEPSQRKAKIRPAPVALADLGPEPDAIAPIETIVTNACQWIHGDPQIPGWRMCGHPGKPWCPYHRQRAYQQKPAKEETAEVDEAA